MTHPFTRAKCTVVFCESCTVSSLITLCSNAPEVCEEARVGKTTTKWLRLKVTTLDDPHITRTIQVHKVRKSSIKIRSSKRWPQSTNNEPTFFPFFSNGWTCKLIDFIKSWTNTTPYMTKSTISSLYHFLVGGWVMVSASQQQQQKTQCSPISGVWRG